MSFKEINLEEGRPTVSEGRERLIRETMKEQKRIVDFIPGEDYSIFDKTTRKLLDSEPQLRQDSDLNRYNNGITWVVLR